MLLILQIALGIVAGYLILAYLPNILAGAKFLLQAILALVAVAAVIWVISKDSYS